MDLSDYRTRLSDVYGNTSTSDDTFYNRIINDAYRKLCALSDWWWLETYEVLTFNAPVVTGKNFDCTNGTADIIASAAGDAVGTAYLNGWVFTGEHTYRLLEIDTAASGLTYTLDSDFIETSSAYSITFWNDMQTLPTAFDHAVSLFARLDPNRKPLQHVELMDIEEYGPDVTPHYNDVGHMFAVWRETAIDDDQMRLRIFPPPSETCEYVLRYIQTPTDMATDSSTAMVPAKHEGVLVDMARLELLIVTGADQSEIAFWQNQVNMGLARIMSDQHKRGNVQRRFGKRGVVRDQLLPYRLTNYTTGDPI